MNNNPLEEVAEYAKEAHKGQLDKSGKPYILHPERVAKRCLPYGIDFARVAWLHDVIEDTDKTLKQVTKDLNLTKAEVKALDLITKKPKQDYNKYLSKLSANKIAWLVKFYDLEDNLSEERLSVLSQKDRERLTKKYNYAMKLLAIGAWVKKEL